MKKIAYQTPVIKTLTMEYIMAATSGVTGEIDNNPTFDNGGTDDDGTLDPDAKAFGNRSVWDD